MSAPDSLRLSAIDETTRHASPLRLHLVSETLVLEACRARAEGIRGVERGGPRSSLSAPRDSVRLVHWADIERVDRGTTNVGEALFYGATIGVAIAYLATSGKPKAGDGGLGDLRPVLIGGFGGLGALLGGLAGTARHVWEPFDPTGVPDSSATARR